MLYLRLKTNRMLLRFLQKVPTFRLLFPFVLGIVFVSDHFRLAWSILLFGLWGLILFRFLESRMPTAWSIRWLPGVSMICLWISLGAFSAGLEHLGSAYPISDAPKIEALVRLESAIQKKPKTYQCEVSVLQADHPVWKGKHLQFYVARDDKSGLLEMGDCILVSFKPQKPEPPLDVKAFDYGAWLRNKGICATAYIPSWAWKIQSKASTVHVRAIADKMRSTLLDRFNAAGISGDEYSMVSALTLGSVQLLTPETKKEFSTSGVSHILSVSGLHVAVVFAILEFLLSFFNRFEKLKVVKQVLIIAVLWCYAFMTGLSPSVIRSAFMFSMIAFGRCLHRKSQTINTVLFSAFILLLWKPSYLFDLGFDLSYCAVISIVVMHERLTSWWKPSSKIMGYFWQMICLSAVAQLGTAPLTIYHFHQFPNYFLLNNLIAVPFSGMIIYLACAFLLLGQVPILGGALSWCLNTALYWFQWFVKTMSELPFALTENLEIQKMEVLLFYVLLGSFFVWFFLKRRKWIFVVLLSVLSLQLLSLSAHFKVQKSVNICEMSAISYICKKTNPCLQKLLLKT